MSPRVPTFAASLLALLAAGPVAAHDTMDVPVSASVKGSDGRTYQCKPFPHSGWCNQAPAYYAPGTGLAWNDAWLLLP